jgi:hypothetical protein
MTATAVTEKLNTDRPAVSMAVARGETIVKEKGLRVVSVKREMII